MVHRNIKLLILLPLLLVCTALSAVGEYKTCMFGTAIPNTGIHVYASSVALFSRIKDLPGKDRGSLQTDKTGLVAYVKVLPKLEVSLAMTTANDDQEFQLQAKYLFWNEDNMYISVAPTFNTHDGSMFHNYSSPYKNWREKCRISGIGIPLIYTFDTQRNLYVTVSACFNYSNVQIWGSYQPQSPYDAPYESYSFNDLPVYSTLLNFSLEAKYKPLSIIPEVGIISFDAHDQGVQQLINYGMSFGLRW